MQYQSDDFKRTRDVVVRVEGDKRCKGAGAVVLSLLFFIPLAPFFGFLQGMSARRWNTRHQTGRSPYAQVAIFAGLILTTVQVFAGMRCYDYYNHLTTGPNQAMSAGFGGKTEVLAVAFGHPGKETQADAFVGELRNRYGSFREARFDPLFLMDSLGGPQMYDLIFEQGIVRAEVTFNFDNRLGPNWMASRLTQITVTDPERGDLGFPSGSAQLVAQQPGEH